jgi:predicted ATPase/DNA-binding SARP family transcriptional activator
LLAYLCLIKQPVARDRLLDLLWPAFAPDDARNNLRRELSLLRSALPDVLLADRHTVALDLSDGRVLVDVRAFEEEWRQAQEHGHPDGELCASCATALESAVARYSGDFLQGFSLPDSPAFDEWQFHQAERLRALLGRALEQLAAWYGERGEHERALAHGRRWAPIDPLDEAPHRALMRLYHAAGQHAAALRHYEQTRRLLDDELGVEPEPETTALYEAIRRRRLLPAVTPATTPPERSALPPVNLPADATPFIGRSRELAQIERLIGDPDVRLVTIMGVGGMGKTRLAIAAARQIAASGAYLDGIFFVPLAPVTQPADVAPALALNLGFTPGGEGDPARQLRAYLKGRRTLLIIDNVEHLAGEESAALFAGILSDAPDVKLLATSRARLGLSGEYVFPLDGLDADLPADGQSADAVALFAAAARRARPSFQLNNDNSSIVSRICRLVGGMPLGIELAAGWLGLLTPQAILEEIERSLDFLESSQADAPARQASLKAVFDSSWRLLTADEQGALRCLSVFYSTFDRGAAEKIAGASLRALLSLANKSWLQSVGAGRYQIHPLLRQYAALEKANDDETEAALRDRHARYYAGLLAALDERMRSRRPAAAFDAVEADLDNVRAAILWLVGQDRLEVFAHQMAIPLFRFLESRYRYFLFEPLLIEAIQRAKAQARQPEYAIFKIFRAGFFHHSYPTRLIDYSWAGSWWIEWMRDVWEAAPIEPPTIDFWSILLAWEYGRFVDATAGAERLRQLTDRLTQGGDRWLEAFARQCLGRALIRGWNVVGFERGQESRVWLQSALSLLESLGDEREAAITLMFIGFERELESDRNEARQILLAAQERLLAIGEEDAAATIDWRLAEIHMGLGEVASALNYFHKMADAFLRTGKVQQAISVMSRESYETARYGDLDDALRLRQRSLALSQQAGDHFTEVWDRWEMGELYRVMGRREEARRWYEASRQIFEELNFDAGQSFYHRGLADLALSEGDTATAEAHFHESYDWAVRVDHPWQGAYALVGLSRTAMAAGQPDEARKYLARGLRAGFATGDPGITLRGIAAAARLFERLGDAARAAGLAQLVLSHALSWRAARLEMGVLLGLSAEESLDRRAARPFDLSATVEALVGELGETL